MQKTFDVFYSSDKYTITTEGASICEVVLHDGTTDEQSTVDYSFLPKPVKYLIHLKMNEPI